MKGLYIMTGLEETNNQLIDERGSLLVMTLMIMLILFILGSAVISIASMERKISNYLYKEEQAHQSADAGVEWAIENIYKTQLEGHLFTHDNMPGLPGFFGVTQNVTIDSRNIQWTIKNGSVDKDDTNYRYLYGFTSVGSFEGVSKVVEVIVGYSYYSVTAASGEQYSLVGDDCDRNIVAYKIVNLEVL